MFLSYLPYWFCSRVNWVRIEGDQVSEIKKANKQKHQTNQKGFVSLTSTLYDLALYLLNCFDPCCGTTLSDNLPQNPVQLCGL